MKTPALGVRASMRAIMIHRYAGEVVDGELPQPQPGPNDLLVEVHAASVNPLDLKIIEGKVKVLTPYRMPLVLGNDLSGVVVAVGGSVSRFRPGDAVFARLDQHRIGAFAEYALVTEEAAAMKPRRLSHAEAAAIPLVGLTSWQALREIGRLGAGQRVLIHAGAGGVGTFAIQLAKHLGAYVFTTASARNHELVRRLGADEAIDYKTTPFETIARDCDVVFDSQGGETLLRSFQSVRRGGVVVTVGGNPDAAFARKWGLNPLLVLLLGIMSRKVTRTARARGARFEYLFMRADGDALGKIADLLDREVIRPVIDRTFPLEKTRDALAYVALGRTVGKVVILVKPDSA